MRLIIAGGRDFNNLDLMVSHLGRILMQTEDDPITVISGTARGADSIGEQWAALNDIPVERYPALWDKYGRSAGYKRNEHMARIATHCVVFWDGKSRGSKHMIDLATKKGLDVRVVSY